MECKKLISIISACLFGFISFASPMGGHFLTDGEYRKQVIKDYELKNTQIRNGELFNIFKQDLTLYEQEALMFLYAYMPVGDIADYSGEYYLENIRLSCQAKNEMPWGKDIPEDVFRHFVLPIRVNNENLDDSRRVFYGELKDRVKGLSLYDAVLEVNHWCHEKVVYTASDARTSSPLASVKTAYGRCGEESTFTVAALRSVGIPARQVYTPRWAHTDDNHAWVEAWVDGKWYFLGACEPDPILNCGWFGAPASRGMLMHTKVFGRYEGNEEIMKRTPTYTEINLIQNYAQTGKSVVEVVDKNGHPVVNAKVEFKVYNYAEFYTVATCYTDEKGQTSLSAGRGDLLVWASKDGLFGYTKVSFRQDGYYQIMLDMEEGPAYAVSLDIVPPAENWKSPVVTPEQSEANSLKTSREDSIRNAYVATFMDEKRAVEFVTCHALPEKVVRFLVASRGNWETLCRFLLNAQNKNKEVKAVDLLSVISAKDLRDVSLEVLEDHLYQTKQEIEDVDLFNSYILNPRVSNEMILPYKSFFQKIIPAHEKAMFKKNPLKLVEWCKENISIQEDLNLSNIFISPIGVWKSRLSDYKSRKVFFVSVARSLGIPAWMDEVTGKVKYMHIEKENALMRTYEVDFDQLKTTQSPAGRLILNYQPSVSIENPKYYTHFSIAKLENGAFHLLNYEESDVDMGGGSTWKHSFQSGVQLDAGYYVLVSGVRLNDGTVCSRMSFFTIEAKKTTEVELVLREKEKDGIGVIGHLTEELSFYALDKKRSLSVHECVGEGNDYILAVIGVGEEPTNHILRDIAALQKEFEADDRPIILLFLDERQRKKFRVDEFPGLPATVVYGIDTDGKVLKSLSKTLHLSDGNLLPVVILANISGDIYFSSQGYTINIGEHLVKELKQLKCK